MALGVISIFEKHRAFPLSRLGVAQRQAPRVSGKKGQSLIEFLLLFPLLFLLAVNVVNFGTFMYAWVTVSNAARGGVQYLVNGGATVYLPSNPKVSQVTAVITKDILSLPNRASLVVAACTNKNGLILISGTTLCTSADPEASNYTLAAVDVTYTYQPMIPLWDIAGMNVHATLPPTTIHRRAMMRVLD